MAGYTREQAKAAAALRAQYSLDAAHRRIDWTFDVLKPTLEKVRTGELVLTDTDKPLLEIEEA
jgi:hypothetical protein